MVPRNRRRFAPVIAILLCAPVVVPAQEAADAPASGEVTAQSVREEISEAFEAIAGYSVRQRDAALAEMERLMADIDARIARLESRTREEWADMSETARARRAEALERLRARRNELSERYGALRAGAEDAWGELTRGVTRAWGALSDAWADADSDATDNTDGAAPEPDDETPAPAEGD
ncbi:hypothetical protein C2I36_13955 [Rhodobacteraceae bacterium WD3A24]|nr:hypothetical protein C2I36_13955 [Rhodobacteraceae bacterium WD3A24]